MSAWRRRGVITVVGLWAIVSVARLSHFIEPVTRPAGNEVAPVLDFFKAVIPPDANYLFVLPGEFGSDTPMGPRLRYELFPRLFGEVRLSAGEAAICRRIYDSNVRFIVVPDATEYPETAWVRQQRPWFRRIDLDGITYVLEIIQNAAPTCEGSP